MGRRPIVHIATIGETPGAFISGENEKNAANANGGGMNGESMTVGIETTGATATTGDANSRRIELISNYRFAGCFGSGASLLEKLESAVPKLLDNRSGRFSPSQFGGLPSPHLHPLRVSALPRGLSHG
jgi:hypothetical protein